MNPDAALDLAIEFDRKQDAEAVVVHFCALDRYDNETYRPTGWPMDGTATIADLEKFQAKVTDFVKQNGRVR